MKEEKRKQLIEDLTRNYHPAKRFHDKMVNYLDEYREYLIFQKTSITSVSSCDIVHQFINFLFNEHLVGSMDEITVAMANSKFYACYRRMNAEFVSKEEMKGILSGFFVFIYGKYGVRNGKIMKGFVYGNFTTK